MTDFSRFDDPPSRVKKTRKPIQWRKIRRALAAIFSIGFVVFCVPATWLALDLIDNYQKSGLLQFDFSSGVDADSEPEPTGLTRKKLKAHYDSREVLSLIQFMEQDDAFGGETVVYFATVIKITHDYRTFHVKYDHGFEWDDFWDNTVASSDFEDTTENRDKLRFWTKGTRLRFECIYDRAMSSLAMQPHWKSCIISEE